MVDRRDAPVEVDDDLSKPGLLERALAVRAVVLQEDSPLHVKGLEQARPAV
jgi:hypothetical protein